MPSKLERTTIVFDPPETFFLVLRNILLPFWRPLFFLSLDTSYPSLSCHQPSGFYGLFWLIQMTSCFRDIFFISCLGFDTLLQLPTSLRIVLVVRQAVYTQRTILQSLAFMNVSNSRMINRLSSDTLLLLSLVHGIVISRPTRMAQTDDDTVDATEPLRSKLFELP
ncbi:hypothetical protein BDR06DRAFT_357040 [Suillus hirtellus]|nr:hypothetical protein BDR06DRAFT_357040 [Suillus hirtellus]